jgi:membrane associated rhomboid family serine protease
MLPIGDVNPRKRFPVITAFLILLNVAVFIYELTLSEEALNAFFYTAGVVPYELTRGAGGASYSTLFTSMFLHGGFVHLFSNMLYLWIFGDNVEDRLGRLFFLIVYLLAGVAANLAQVYMDPTVTLPLVGASGAIAGVLGTYIVLFPHARVRTLLILYFIRYVELPAWIVLGFWFVLQLFDGVASIGNMAQGGVAYFAHIGGFVVGLIVGALIRATRGRDEVTYLPRRRQ